MAHRRTRIALLAAAFAAATTLQAQSHPGPRSPDRPDDGGYGTADQFLTVVAASEFVPSVTAQANTSHNAIDGSRWMSAGVAGSAQLVASLNGRLPEGAVIDQMCVYGVDSFGGAGQNLIAFFSRYGVDVATGDPASQQLAVAESVGAPDDFARCVALNETFRSRWDVDGDGDPDAANYNIRVDFGESRDLYSASLRLRSLTFRWRRQVSAPPLVATFADVPTSHPYFSFIEALVSAGITAGCGGGNYCVNTPITRGEMAVFLAAALGLHWPAF